MYLYHTDIASGTSLKYQKEYRIPLSINQSINQSIHPSTSPPSTSKPTTKRIPHTLHQITPFYTSKYAIPRNAMPYPAFPFYAGKSKVNSPTQTQTQTRNKSFQSLKKKPYPTTLPKTVTKNAISRTMDLI
jgi:hypothetical protein